MYDTRCCNTVHFMFIRKSHVLLRRFIPYTRSLSTASETMEKVTVRCIPTDKDMQISFVHGEKHANLLREQREALGKSLSRIANNIRKASQRGKKNKKMKRDSDSACQPVPNEEIAVSLFKNSDRVPEDVSNEEAWQDGAILQIGDHRYEVVRNPPTILNFSLPNSMMAGFPVYPRVEMEFGNVEKTEFMWYKEVKEETLPGSSDSNTNQPEEMSMKTERDNDAAMETESTESVTVEKKILKIDISATRVPDKWTEILKGKVYKPTNSDIGQKLKVVCVPADGNRQGTPLEVVSNPEISAGPGLCPFENRHLYTQKTVGPEGFRVVSYNILADPYATTEFAQNVLFPYCAPYALEVDYREQLIIKEITGYNSDIVCLQEMGKKLYNTALYPALQLEGMEGVYTGKAGEIREGEAIFYKKDKFRLLSRHDIKLNEYLQQEMNSDLLEKISSSKALLEKVLTRSAILQVAMFETLAEPKKKLCVANTHLYFHPRAANIRLIQIELILRHLQCVTSMHCSEGQDGELPIVLCGDFNSDPKYGVYKYITSKSIPANYADWHSAGKDEYSQGLALQHNFEFRSACGIPDYTNYVAGFKAAIDYIFIDRNFDVLQVIPMPTDDELSLHTALPSVVFPSDHIALVVDLAWSSNFATGNTGS
ncbi:2',5'-phosphodiesterase 12-like [Ptychodera flava]|uniref:2',5'-phosphodiesterase 12-like n=1 Tax=Ptychodera flava TaxID=63121 RepID=UPI003969C01C